MDDELSFRDHISDMCKKASRKVEVLMRLCSMIPCEAKLPLISICNTPAFHVLSYSMVLF